MSREEIREELAKRRYYDGWVGIGSGIPKWEDRTEVEREHFRRKIDSDLTYLHDNDVVIKVDRELPECSLSNLNCDLSCHIAEQRAMLKAGYTAFKSLIGE